MAARITRTLSRFLVSLASNKMRFSLSQCLVFVALIAIQMSNNRIAFGGVIASCFVFLAAIVVFSFKSTEKIVLRHTTQETAENVIMLSIANFLIICMFLAGAG